MVNQGYILKLYIGPVKGHEQDGYRPVIVVSNDVYNALTNIIIVCPITSTDNGFPPNVALTADSETSGFIMCNHIKALDLSEREYKFVERAPMAVITRACEVVRSLMQVDRSL
jgi:mRNA interferase MazF